MISCNFIASMTFLLRQGYVFIPVLECCNSICIQLAHSTVCQRPSIRRCSVALHIVLSSNSMFILNQFLGFQADQIQASSSSNTAHSIELGRLALLENTV